jgi:carbamoyl-phosphate synthase small subunit
MPIMKLREQVTAIVPGAEVGGKAVLVLEDGTVFVGRGLGAFGHTLGEVCFNTSMTGYQEILTDPSYAGQIITFTFPHIGNVGANDEDIESRRPSCRGLVLREDITAAANWRARSSLDRWLKERNLIGIAGVDTRRLVGRIRDRGAPKGCLAFPPTVATTWRVCWTPPRSGRASKAWS